LISFRFIGLVITNNVISTVVKIAFNYWGKKALTGICNRFVIDQSNKGENIFLVRIFRLSRFDSLKVSGGFSTKFLTILIKICPILVFYLPLTY